MATKKASAKSKSANPGNSGGDGIPSSSGDSDEPMPLKDQMDYAMEHFSFIAEQRLKVFNFYIIVLAADITAFVAFLTKEPPKVSPTIWYSLGVAFWGMLNIGTGIVFTMIEQRNLSLLKVARDGVQEIERQPGWPPHIRLSIIDNEANKKEWRRRMVSYQSAFRLTHAGQILLGFFAIVVALLILAWDFGRSTHPSQEPRKEDGANHESQNSKPNDERGGIGTDQIPK